MQAIWIEIPVSDLARATRFYAEVFGHETGDAIEDGPRRITIIPGEPTVSLNQTPGFTPAAAGPLPYIEVTGPIADAVARVSAAGGTVVDAPAARGENGVFALVLDTEGNHLTLHGVS